MPQDIRLSGYKATIIRLPAFSSTSSRSSGSQSHVFSPSPPQSHEPPIYIFIFICIHLALMGLACRARHRTASLDWRASNLDLGSTRTGDACGDESISTSILNPQQRGCKHVRTPFAHGKVCGVAKCFSVLGGTPPSPTRFGRQRHS